MIMMINNNGEDDNNSTWRNECRIEFECQAHSLPQRMGSRLHMDP